MEKKQKQFIVIGLVVIAALYFGGFLPFTIGGACPYGQDANGLCTLKQCSPGDLQCESYNIKAACISAAQCPDIVTQSTINFNLCYQEFGVYCNSQCKQPAVHTASGWQCIGETTSVDNVCIQTKLNACEQKRIDWLASNTPTPMPSQQPTPTPGTTATPTGYPTPTIYPTPTPTTPPIIPGTSNSSVQIILVIAIAGGLFMYFKK